MKKHLSYVFVLIMLQFYYPLSAQELNYQDKYQTNIGKFFEVPGKLGVFKYWELEEIKGRDKIYITLHAVEAFDNTKSQEVFKGLRLKMHNESKLSGKDIQFPFRELTIFVDRDEFANILIALDEMLKQYNVFKKNNQNVSYLYTTTENFSFGFVQFDRKMRGFACIKTNSGKIEFEIRNGLKYLRKLKTCFTETQQELYLPENAAKVRKAKSSKNANKVIDEDI